MQRETRTTFKQTNKPTSAQTSSRTVSGQAQVTSSQVSRGTASQTVGAVNPSNASANNSVVCRTCNGTQIVANKRGYSFANMFLALGWMTLIPILITIILVLVTTLLLWNGGTSVLNAMNFSSASIIDGIIGVIMLLCLVSLSLSLPVSILIGFKGRSELVNNCMNCGFKWTPGKSKKK